MRGIGFENFGIELDISGGNYLRREQEEIVLGQIGKDRNEEDKKAFMDDLLGLPVGYLRYVGNPDALVSYKELTAEAENNVRAQFGIIQQKTPALASLIQSYVLGKAVLNIDERQQLINAGFASMTKDGTLFMPPLVRRIVRREMLKTSILTKCSGISLRYLGITDRYDPERNTGEVFYTDTYHYGRYHTEGGINATLADHLLLMMDFLRGITEGAAALSPESLKYLEKYSKPWTKKFLKRLYCFMILGNGTQAR